MNNNGNNVAQPAVDFTKWINVVVPNIRNGDIDLITDMTPTQYLADEYKWVSLRGATHTTSESLVHPYIMAQYGQLMLTTDAAAQPVVAARNRKIAIIMGTIRCIVHGSFRLMEGDMTRAECVRSGMTVQPGKDLETVLAERATLRVNMALPEAEREADLATRRAAIVVIAPAVVAGNGAETSAAQLAREAAFGQLNPVERKMARAFAWMAPSIPLLQGASLIHSGHHYIKTTYNMFDGVVRQSDFLRGAEFETWIEDIKDSWKGYAFHDATHPIVPDRKREWARLHSSAARIEKAGHKAAIVRLPGLPAECQGLKAGVAVIIKAKSALERLGATIWTTRGVALLAQLEGTSEGQDYLSDEDLATKIVESKLWYDENQGHISYCAGVVDGLHAEGSAASDKKLPVETTTKALSVTKAINNNISMYTMGLSAASSMMKLEKRRLEQDGKLELIISV